jgi:UDP-N-acetylglucosamine 4,6-dehydratase
MLTGRVLITGGSGFLGRGILRRIRREKWPAQVTIYSRDETKQYEVKRRWPEANCILGDVRDADRLEAVMVGHDLVIHAAAVKYIPEAEKNVAETISVNVQGSYNVAKAAARAGVKTVVGISTDKACSPLNTYGATKMLMERLFAEANTWSDTKFVTCRYGNVVGSTGSVVPIFQQQIRDSSVIRITDDRMTRFWLSIDEAIDLIDQAQSDPLNAGSCYISKCPAMSIKSLAEAVWTNYWSQLTDGGGPEPVLVKTGIRPGEKLYESLYNEQEWSRVQWTRDGFILKSPLESVLPAERPELESYSSNSPDRILQVKEMIELIEDAKEVWL